MALFERRRPTRGVILAIDGRVELLSVCASFKELEVAGPAGIEADADGLGRSSVGKVSLWTKRLPKGFQNLRSRS